MGLWQHLCEAYTQNEAVLSHYNLYPLSTTSISNVTERILVVVLNGDGQFLRIREISKKSKSVALQTFTIPVSEASAGRTRALTPHPIFDQFEYVRGGEGNKFKAYCKQLKQFSEAVGDRLPDVQAVYAYIAEGSLEQDVIRNTEISQPKDKMMVLFSVERQGVDSANLWENDALFAEWHKFYVALREGTDGGQKCLDMITGEEMLRAESHPKKIVNVTGNAKLISDNDDTNFTYRGRFVNSTEAFAIGYESSQRAHQFLRYLVNNRGIACGEQVLVTFSLAGERLPNPPVDDFSLDDEAETELDSQIALAAGTGRPFSVSLRKALNGFRYQDQQKKHAPTCLIMLDAATTGRLSITCYREMAHDEYIEAIAAWHETCQWHLSYWRKQAENKNIRVDYIGAPTIDRIVEAVYGRPRGTNDAGYVKVKKVARELLVRCIFDNAPFPRDYLMKAIARTSNPLSFTDNGRFERDRFHNLVAVTCALMRKFYHDEKKETFSMSIELNRTDRDYLYGRLLGAADTLEEYALYQRGNDRLVTAAIRYMQSFSQRPFTTWRIIHDSLSPYFQVVKGCVAFQEIQAISALFQNGDYEKDAPLDGSYLIGYYHEREYVATRAKELSECKKNQMPQTEEKEENHE